MGILPKIFVGIVALEHCYILWLEMFAWTTAGRRVFRSIPTELFEPTKTFAANQGLYNGFLAAGLIWSLFIGDPVWSKNVAFYFSGCISIAGVFGAVTAQRSIFYTQALPALITCAMIVFV